MNESKKIIVTGGAGFIGSHLVDRLLASGHRVLVLDNLYTGKEDFINPRADFEKLDIRDDRAAVAIEKFKPGLVYHLAAQIDVAKSVQNPDFDREVNLEGSKNVFAGARQSRAGKIVFVSTGGALYGDCTEPAHEETPVEYSSPYAENKHKAEEQLKSLAGEHGTGYAIMRPANVYGPRQYKGGECGVIGIFTHNAAKGRPSVQYGDGSKTRDYVFVEDLVKALDAAQSKTAQGVYNIGLGREVSNLDIIKTIENILGREFDYSFAPDKPGEVRRSVLQAARARRDLGWQPSVQLEEGVRRTLEWLEANK